MLLFIDIDQTFWIGRRLDTWIQRGQRDSIDNMFSGKYVKRESIANEHRISKTFERFTQFL